jgi:CxxC-x17-CxxC domain-containing protein
MKTRKNKLGTDFDSLKRSVGGDNFHRTTKELHQAECADCGCKCEVPFKPILGKPVFCRDCFNKNTR